MPESHTATEQWQSFELRMRQRRLERCLVRAAAALDADVLDIAREALEEALHLGPSDPRLPDLARRLEMAEASPAAIAAGPSLLGEIEAPPVVIQQPPKSRGWLWAGALALIVMSGVAGWFAAGHATIPQWSSLRASFVTEREPATTAVPETTAAPSPPAPTATESSRETEPVPVAAPDPVAAADSEAIAPATDKPATAALVEKPTGTVGPETSKTTAVEMKANVAPTPPPVARREVDLRPDAAVTKPAPLTAPVGSSVTVPPTANDAPALQPTPALPEPPANVPAAPLPGAATEAAARPATTSAPSANAAAPDATANDERLVRVALNRYAAAYNGLDAAAARAVWPSVDQRALARAFDGLLAQNIALGQCDVHVSGAVARAECSGRANWTPKVGGGPHSAARRWRFDLRNTGGDWIIVQANVR